MLKKVRIISNSICYGPQPELEDEVEQRLSITDEGRGVLVRYNYAGKRIEYKQLKLPKEEAQAVLRLIESGISAEEYLMVTDVGCWGLAAETSNGETIKIGGSLVPIQKDLTAASIKMRELTQLPLLMFDGGVDE